MPRITSHRELRVYQSAMAAAIKAIKLADRFPAEERYGWKMQAHKSAPSVCASIAEAFRKRRYRAHFISKLTDSEAEAAETQVWMELAWQLGHITEAEFLDIFGDYEKVLGQLVLFEENTIAFGKKIRSFLLLLGPALIAALAFSGL